MKLSRFKMDNKKQLEGVWVDAGDGLRLRVARLGNEKYKAFLRTRGKSLAVQVRTGNFSQQEAMELQQQAIAHTVLLEWTNLVEDDGAVIPYSPGKALELFRSHPDFLDLVTEFASDAALYRDQAVEDAQGN
jgi:hypothetical protein